MLSHFSHFSNNNTVARIQCYPTFLTSAITTHLHVYNVIQLVSLQQ